VAVRNDMQQLNSTVAHRSLLYVKSCSDAVPRVTSLFLESEIAAFPDGFDIAVEL
jgi:hypothetical protein